MDCSAISTGTQFLSGLMNHIDCQSRNIGSYGYGALADPRSAAFAVTTGLLAIFVALHGIRLMFDGQDYSRRLVHDVVKIGIVLTLATSWPAWRMIGFDLVMNGPTELAQAIGLASGTTSNDQDSRSQVQALDDAMVVMTAYGTGRLSGGGIPQGTEVGDSFRGIALADQSAFGWGRSAFLIGTIVPFGIARLGAGLLLALAPLIAGLYLFGATAGIFIGWTRGLAFCALASLAQYLIQAVEIDLLTPWVLNVVAVRQGGILTPSAPTELLVITSSFTMISLGSMLVFAKTAFYPGASVPFLAGGRRESQPHLIQRRSELWSDRPESIVTTRAQRVAEAVSHSMRQERMSEQRMYQARTVSSSPMTGTPSAGDRRSVMGRYGEGGGKRSPAQRTSASAQQRDLR